MRAPAFALGESSGKRFDSRSVFGRPLLIVFFTGRGQTALLRQARDTEARFKDQKLAVVAVHYADEKVKPEDQMSQVASSLPPEELKIPVLLYGRPAALNCRVAKDNAAFLVDGTGVILGSASFAGAPAGLLIQKVAIWIGPPPVKQGWRNDLVVAWEYAIEGTRDAGGNMRPATVKPVPLAAEQATRELRSFAPDAEIKFHVLTPGIPAELVQVLNRLVDQASREWKTALPQIRFTRVEQREQADLLLLFRSPVSDPNDNTGIRTVCSYFRTQVEPAPRDGPVASRIVVLAQIAGNHGPEQSRHTANATQKLVLAAFGYALGLAERQDPQSVMRPGADDPNTLVLSPSEDDVLLVRHLWANVGLQLCKSLIEAKKVDDARKTLDLIPPDLKQYREAEEVVRKGS